MYTQYETPKLCYQKWFNTYDINAPKKKKKCDGISLVDTYQSFRGTYYSHLWHSWYPDDEGTRLL